MQPRRKCRKQEQERESQILSHSSPSTRFRKNSVSFPHGMLKLGLYLFHSWDTMPQCLHYRWKQSGYCCDLPGHGAWYMGPQRRQGHTGHHYGLFTRGHFTQQITMDTAITALQENKLIFLAESTTPVRGRKVGERDGSRKWPHIWLTEKMYTSFSNTSICDGILWQTMPIQDRI